MPKLRQFFRRDGPSSSTAETSGERASSGSTHDHGSSTEAPGAASEGTQNSSLPTTLKSAAIKKGSNYGITVLFDPGVKATIDIVFVHGLTGNAYTTWLHKETETHWPSKFLHEDLPNARILCFGYDADIVQFWNPASSATLSDHAQQLVGSLVGERELTNTEDRNIIFVAHSLGGLLTKAAVFHSQNGYEDHLHQIERCTYGIIFLGTPHHGSDLAKWAKFGTDIAGLVRPANKGIVAVLKPGSEMLRQIENNFHIILRKRKHEGREIVLTSFWEELSVGSIGQVDYQSLVEDQAHRTDGEIDRSTALSRDTWISVLWHSCKPYGE